MAFDVGVDDLQEDELDVIIQAVITKWPHLLIAIHVIFIQKEEKDAEKVKSNYRIFKDARTPEKDVTDEACPDSVYESEVPPDNSKAILKPPEVLPTPVRDRTLGGIDYYSLTYDDPIFDDEDY